MKLSRQVVKTSLILYGICQVLFLINIQFPRTPNFDEFHYIPSAKQFLALIPNQNWEHPPLGKMLLSIGIALFGDRPIGWRFMSTVFGSLTLMGMYFLGWVIFESEQAALWIALITLCNQLLYVQARIGMLDTFMMGFLVWALVGFCATMNLKISSVNARRWIVLSGLMFGLSIACKWFSIVPWIACIALVCFVRLMQVWHARFEGAKETDWYHPRLWSQLNWQSWILGFGILPVAVYFLTFLPFLWIPNALSSFSDLISMQFRMFDGQLRVVSSHPYMSRWWEWPLMTRPIWYAFDREGPAQTAVRGVLLLGNPLIMWTGLVALLFCLWQWIKTRDRKAFLILFFYFAFYGCWTVIPRKICFYYYYYPAGLILSLALAYVFQSEAFFKLCKRLHLQSAAPMIPWAFLGLAFSLFVYFFPILAALRIPADSFRGWMWFQSWI